MNRPTMLEQATQVRDGRRRASDPIDYGQPLLQTVARETQQRVLASRQRVTAAIAHLVEVFPAPGDTEDPYPHQRSRALPVLTEEGEPMSPSLFIVAAMMRGHGYSPRPELHYYTTPEAPGSGPTDTVMTVTRRRIQLLPAAVEIVPFKPDDYLPLPERLSDTTLAGYLGVVGYYGDRLAHMSDGLAALEPFLQARGVSLTLTA